jgi:hypothetical protein
MLPEPQEGWNSQGPRPEEGEICAAHAGLGGAWFYDALVQSDVVVTNRRGSYREDWDS